MGGVLSVKRDAMVLVLDYEGIDFETVLESAEDQLDLRYGQRNRSGPETDLCVWHVMEDEREAVLDGGRLQLAGEAWFGPGSEAYVQGIRTLGAMLPLRVLASGVNPVFEMPLTGPEELDPTVRLGERFMSAFDDDLALHELVWCSSTSPAGHTRFRMRVLCDPWRVSIDCNWHWNHCDGDIEEAVGRMLGYHESVTALSERLTRAFAGGATG